MEKTQFLGITTLGPTDSIYDDNAAFLSRDRLELDRAGEIGVKIHRHTGLPGLSNPEVAASAEVVASAGQIASDLIISVGYTLQDDQLGETELSPVAIVSTPGPMSIPQITPSASLSYESGNLLTNSYYYAITYVDGEGGETPLGPPVVAEREPGFPNGQVELSNLNVGMEAAGAMGWRLYRSIGGGTYGLLAEGEGGTFIDDGSKAADCQVNPPGDNVNTTNQVSTLFVTLPAIGQGATSINLYANIDGDFSGASLLAQYPIASAGETVSFDTLSFLDSSPPDTNRSYGGAPKIDPDTELLDWHWKRPVKTVGELPTEGNEEGDVRAILEAEEPTVYMFLNGEWQLIETGGGGGGSLRVTEQDYLYWSDTSLKTIGRATISGEIAEPGFIAPSPFPRALVADNTYLYWFDLDLDNIGRAKLDGSEVDNTFIEIGTATGAGQMAVNDTHLFWADSQGNTIERANIDGTGLETSFISDPSDPQGVAVDDAHIYWTDWPNGTIGRANLDGTEANNSFISGLGEGVSRLAVDGEHIYWTDDDKAAIGRAKIDGSEVEPEFITAPVAPRGLALDSYYLYWSDQETNNIGRVKLDGSEPNAEFITAPTGVGVGFLAIGRQVSVEPTSVLEFAASGIASIDIGPLGSGVARVTIDVPEAELLDITASGVTVSDAHELEFVGSGGVTVSETEPSADLAEVLIEGDRALLAQEGMGVIVHGSDATVARPNRFKQYTWFGSVEPENMADFDTWIETT